MTIVVPFDGTDLSKAALVRADEFGAALDEPLVVVTIIPNANREYARDNGWLAEDESFDLGKVVSSLSRQVTEISPVAVFEYEVVDRYAPPGSIARHIRNYAKEFNARLVVLGSENAGRIVTSLSSVGGSIASDSAYDVLIVRHVDSM